MQFVQVLSQVTGVINKNGYLEGNLSGGLLIEWDGAVVPSDGGRGSGPIGPTHQANGLALGHWGGFQALGALNDLS